VVILLGSLMSLRMPKGPPHTADLAEASLTAELPATLDDGNLTTPPVTTTFPTTEEQG